MPTASSLPAAAAWPPDARAWVEVDLGALQRNASAVARHAAAPLLPMVKADAYGLGAVPVARALAAADPWGFGLATVDEARVLREAGLGHRLLVFTPLLARDYPQLRALGATPVLGSATAIRAWHEAGGGAWHLGIDTGMGRSGVRWDGVEALAPLLAERPPEGACTHYHSADHDAASVAGQARRFEAALAALPARPPLVHAENSAAVEHAAGATAYSLVRPGVFLYGVETGGALRPAPVVAFRAPVVELRTIPDGDTVSYDATYRARGERRIATASVGYADGYRRALSNRGQALLNGRRVPVAGIVTMDMTMFDTTDVRCAVGDTLTLVGRDGDAELTVADVARAGDLSPYELLTGLAQRASRCYHGADA